MFSGTIFFIERNKECKPELLEIDYVINHYSIENKLMEIAEKYELDYERFYNVAFCESTVDQSKIGKAGEIGIFQFKKTTFEEYADKYKKVGFSVYDINNQIELAGQMFSNGKSHLWTCEY